MITLDEVHARAVDGDRKLRIIGAETGYWYEDHILDYVGAHKYSECAIVNETDEMITVEVLR